MKTVLRILTALGLMCQVLGWNYELDPKDSPNPPSSSYAVPIDISSLRNNQAFGMTPGEANFDRTFGGYPAKSLPPSNLTLRGVAFDFPQYGGTNSTDNVIAEGQELDINPGRYIGFSALVAADVGIVQGIFNATYNDGSTSSSGIISATYWRQTDVYGGDVTFPALMQKNSTNGNFTYIFQVSGWLDSGKTLSHLTLPNVSTSDAVATNVAVAATAARLHIFSLSLIPANGEGLALSVETARTTSSWLPALNGVQIVEAIVDNVGSEWITNEMGLQAWVESDSVETVQPACIKRLRPGDQAVVQIGVSNKWGVSQGSQGSMKIKLRGASINSTSPGFEGHFGIGRYEATFDSVYQHEAPEWNKGAKFGIFIHWGIFSVPAWGGVGPNETYAEGYWFDYEAGPKPYPDVYQYNLDTYGPNHEYDDFLPEYTASAWDPKEWVDLFDDAGATYFVLTSKHVEGFNNFALPDNVTRRTSMNYGPHRNLVKDLFDAASEYHPSMYKGIYYSLVESYNPAYKKYGFGNKDGGNATNPYTNKTVPYTGYVEIDDYLSDYQLPSMKVLASMGADIMWCDVSSANLSIDFAAEYFNNATKEGRQVVMNNRCGIPGDFDTPEYATYIAVQRRKWESTRGMDPHSFGYNRATPEDAYLKPERIVQAILDISSKNGNFLLDVGPQANGTIIQVEQDNLRAAGKWLKDHGEGIYNTTFWYVTPQEGELRFSQTQEAFYISVLSQPNDTLTVTSPVPYMDGDQVTIVGGNMSGTVIPSSLQDGELVLNTSKEIQSSDQWAWMFKIPFC